MICFSANTGYFSSSCSSGFRDRETGRVGRRSRVIPVCSVTVGISRLSSFSLLHRARRRAGQTALPAARSRARDIFVRGSSVFSYTFSSARVHHLGLLLQSSARKSGTTLRAEIVHSLSRCRCNSFSCTTISVRLVFCPHLCWALVISFFLPYTCCRMSTFYQIISASAIQ